MKGHDGHQGTLGALGTLGYDHLALGLLWGGSMKSHQGATRRHRVVSPPVPQPPVGHGDTWGHTEGKSWDSQRGTLAFWGARGGVGMSLDGDWRGFRRQTGCPWVSGCPGGVRTVMVQVQLLLGG